MLCNKHRNATFIKSQRKLTGFHDNFDGDMRREQQRLVMCTGSLWVGVYVGVLGAAAAKESELREFADFLIDGAYQVVLVSGIGNFISLKLAFIGFLFQTEKKMLADPEF